MKTITLHYRAVDGEWTEQFSTLSEAAAHLRYQLGRFDDGGHYAVSFDGIATCYAADGADLRDVMAAARSEG